jgi:hypothetical protein
MRRATAWTALALLVALSTVLRAFAATRVPVPWIPVDETLYAKLGQSLYRHGRLELLGEPTGLYTLVYPALVGIPLSLGSLQHGYTALKVVQAATMSLAAVPVYGWTRELASRPAALAAGALTLAVPGLAYAGLVMTEVAFYVVLVLAAWACARALAEPTLARQALAVGALLLASATRIQAVVLPIAFAGAALLLALLERRSRPLVRLAPTWIAFAVLGLAWILWRIVRGVPVLGAYEAAANSSYSVVDSLVAIVRHTGDLVLLTAVVPAAAFVLLAVDVLRRRDSPPAERAYVAVALAFVVATLFQVAIFASKHVGYIAERNLIALAPLVFVGFAAWIDRGAPRTRVLASVVCVLVLLPVLAIPLDNFLSAGSLPFSFTALALERVLGSHTLTTQELAIFGAAALAVAFVALTPRRLAWILVPLVLVALALLSVPASRGLVDASRTQQARFLGPVKDWVDRAGAGPAFYLYDGDRDVDAVWENMFWNDDIRAVYDLPGNTVIGPVAQQEVALWPDGKLLPAPEQRSVVASSNLTFDGEPVAEAPQQLPGQAGLRLWRLDGPPRVALRMTGFQANGDVYGGATGTVTVFGCRPGKLHVTVLIKTPVRITLTREGVPWQTRTFYNQRVWHARIPAPPGHDGRDACFFELKPNALMGTTLIEFEPAA